MAADTTHSICRLSEEVFVLFLSLITKGEMFEMMSPLKLLLALLLFSLSQGCQPKVSALIRAIQGFGKFVTQNMTNCEPQVS